MSSSASPKVSVLMAVHNGLEHLPAAVESILSQTLADFELIVVDDGSTDGAETWLARKAAEEPRLVVIRHANRGLTASLNVGLAAARGELVARMDADDLARADRLQKQAAEFDRDAGLVLLGSEVELIDSQGVKLGPRRHFQDHTQIRRQLLLGDGGALTHPAVMFRRQIAVDIGGYDEEFPTTQDLDLFLRLSEKGAVRNLPESLVEWRQHGRSVNRTRSDTWLRMKRLAIRKTIDRIGSEAYANELFAEAEAHSFPDSPAELAAFAARRGRRRSAFHYGQLLARTPGSRLQGLRICWQNRPRLLAKAKRLLTGWRR